jgi:hypothetical protein
MHAPMGWLFWQIFCMQFFLVPPDVLCQCLRLGHSFLQNPFQFAVDQLFFVACTGFLPYLAHVVGHFLFFMELGWLTELPKLILLPRDCYMSLAMKSVFSHSRNSTATFCVSVQCMCYSIQGARYVHKDREEFPDALAPNMKIIYKYLKRFWAMGSAAGKKRKCTRHMLTVEKLHEIGASVQENHLFKWCC